MISILIALALAYRLNKKIETEISAISDYLENIESKNYSSRLETTFAKEFVIISYLIKKLAKRLDKRAKQKRKQTAKLKLLNKQKDEIISAISHEFKNPIAVIVGYCETLTNDKDINEKMRDRFLSKISVNATKLSNMINRLRLAVSLEDKEYKPSFSNMNIYNITNNAITLLKEAYKDRDVLLHGSDTTVNVDPVLMDIAITNIIENALKYSEDIVEVYIEDNSITIKDYGFGISQDDIDKITDKFYRVDKNIWNNSLGLGLSIVNRILKIHNFTLAITSQEDIGSEFKITFND
jgi:signal transduction histidine kinase